MGKVARAFVIAVGVILSVSNVGFAKTQTLGPQAISQGDPYASCMADAGTGKLYPSAEVEPQVTASSSLAVAAWQQDRWSNGGAHGLVSAASKDGGKTWSEYPQPFSVCAQPYYRYQVAQYNRASDPWVSIGPDGTIYSNAITFNGSNHANGVFAATSTDGLHWTKPLPLVQYLTNGGQFSTDKNSITADPVTVGTAYSVWDTLVGATDNPDDNPHAIAYNGDAYFSMTTDGGNTWTTPAVIFPTTQNTQTIDNIIVVDARTGPNTPHTLYDFAAWIVHPNSFANTQTFAAFVKSTDGGMHWSPPQTIAQIFTVGVNDPNTGAAIRTGALTPSPAIDPATGQLYVVWEESSAFKRGNTQGAEDDTITLATSIDGGASWAITSPVNKFKAGVAAFTPTVQVGAGGEVAVTYYDFRNLTSGNTTTLSTDYWITYSGNGGASFGDERHVGGSFNMLAAANAFGFFVGDYEGLAATGSGFLPVFGMTNCADSSCAAGSGQDPQDIYTALGF